MDDSSFLNSAPVTMGTPQDSNAPMVPTVKRLRLPTKILIIAAVNFLSFLVFSLLLGGDGLNGEKGDGRYFISNHGIRTEVTALVFYYTAIHALSMFVTHFSAIGAGIYIGRPSRFTYRVSANRVESFSDRQFVLLTFLFFVGIPALIVFPSLAMRPNAPPLEHRVEAGLVQELPESAITKEQGHSSTQWRSLSGPDSKIGKDDIDNDGIVDEIRLLSGINIRLAVSSNPDANSLLTALKRHRIGAVGFADVDSDGNKDVWWLDSGDDHLQVLFGDGQGGFPSREAIDLRSSYFESGSLQDIDGDGHLDFAGKLFCCGNCGESTSYDSPYWINLHPTNLQSGAR